jgi:hypothetical protein
MDQKFSEAMIAGFTALRVHVDALYALVRAAGLVPDAELLDTCSHLEVENEGTFGAPVFRCKACKAIVAELLPRES